MSEAFRDISPDAPELQPIISGLFAEYAAATATIFPAMRKWS
ncbi:N-acetyltransferase GCN5 [Klebsiella aerogenes]|nr:N-acetyltransferase GCN5 [Klebsiella aerogenes]